MKEEIIKYLSKYVPLDEESKKAILISSFIKSFKKGTVLLEQGKLPEENYFVLKGCVRSFRMHDGDEQTIEFYTEEDIISPLEYGKNLPSSHSLECIEDTIATVSNAEMEREGFEKFPQFESICRVMSEAFMTKNQEKFVNFKLATPEERYKQLLQNRPDLFQRAPQYQIASYLGITPESLSRIRKRLAKNKD